MRRDMFEETRQPHEHAPLRTVHDRKPTANIIAGRNPVMEALKAGFWKDDMIDLAMIMR